MRLILIVLALVVFSLGDVSSAPKPVDSDKVANKIDPIITGKRVTPEQYQRWLAVRQLAIKCPDCTIPQPFPTENSD